MNQKKHWIIFLCSLLVFVSLPSSTIAKDNTNTGSYDSKDEVVYGNLNGDGTIHDLYVVNSFDINKPGKITDYGSYQAVRNLTNLSELIQTKDEVNFQVEEEEEFYYQGELDNKPLPWDISITYLLDDEEVEANELAGKSGHLDIQISTSENKDVDPVFFENYLLQISLTMDPLIFDNIQAPEATEANEGKDKNFSFSIMPDQEEDLIISSDVTDLEMDPIDISAVPANIAMEDPDIGEMTSEMAELADGIKEINNGVAELADGISEWSNGASELKEGASAFQSGLQELDNSSGELIEGSKQILGVMRDISGAMENAPDFDQWNDTGELEELPHALRETAGEIKDYSNNIDEVNDELNQIPEEEIPSISENQFQEIREMLEENEVDEEILNNIDQLEKWYQTSEDMQDLDLDIPDDATGVMNDMVSELESLADEIENNLNNLDQLEDLEELSNGITTMAEEYESFHEGLVSYTEGVHELNQSYNEIDSGINELTNGASSLKDGVTELQEGTQALEEETADLPHDMESELDELMEEFDFSDFEPTSFVSDKNEKVDVVQFVLQTEKIKPSEPEKSTEEEEEKSLWDRFLDLFR